MITIPTEQAAIDLAVALDLRAISGRRRTPSVALWQQTGAIIVVAAKCHFCNRVINYTHKLHWGGGNVTC